MGFPPNIHTRPFRCGMDFKGNSAPNKIKMAWSSPQKSKKKTPPEPYQATCPQHGEDVPMLMGTRASSPQPLPGGCGGLWGAYQNLEDPFNTGDPKILPPLCELVMGYIVPLPFHGGSVNSCKKNTHTPWKKVQRW